MTIRPFTAADQPAVIALWQACGLTRPWNDPAKDIARKQQIQSELFLVAEVDGEIAGSVMAGYDGHRGWINYLAVIPHSQRLGIGRALMDAAEAGLRSLGCPKINLQVRAENEAVIQFYKQLGFQEDRVLSFGKRLERDEPAPASA